ncbi:PIN domain nuclease [Candidatus Acetothermia bacterium]|nr:PIN domain nuclease [Candidatus Acetothermia bacterium]
MKTSKASAEGVDRIVVDANPIISAVIGGKAREIFLTSNIKEFATTEFTWQEALEYLPEMARKPRVRRAGIPLSELYTTLVALPLVVYEYEFYQERMTLAQSRMEKRDPDDAPLALKLRAPVWTNDEDFAVSGIEWFTTAEFLKRLSE